jgi:predicted nucleic acid-binding protein
VTEVWLDTNVVLRFLTGEPPDLFRRAQRLMRRAARGEVVARITHVALAETVWVLGSFYGRDATAIAETLRSFVLADGVSVDDPDAVLEALRLMVDANVAYIDAYVAVTARRSGQPVASFDADFRRLGVELEQLT